MDTEKIEEQKPEEKPQRITLRGKKTNIKQAAMLALEAQSLSHTGSFGWIVSSGEMYWSDEAFRIFEIDPAAKPSLDAVLQRVHPDDRALVQQIIARASKDGTDLDFEHRLLMPDNRVKCIHVVARVVQHSSDNIEFVGAVIDITERKRAEETLRRSEAYLSEAQRLTKTGSWAYNLFIGKTIYWSEEMFRIYGLDPRQGPPTSEAFWERVHPEDRDSVYELMWKAALEKTDYEHDHRIVLPDGTVKHIHAIGHPVLNRAGDGVEFVGTAVDVTERKRAEEEIRKQESELREILNFMPQMVAVMGPDGRISYANEVMLQYFGITLEESRTGDFGARFVHPDDVEMYGNERRKAFARGLPFENEERMRGKDGKYRWFLLRHNPLTDAQGRVVRWYVTELDIEDRKQAEKRLQHENVALREEIDKASMFEEIVGASPALKAVLARVAKVAPTDASVFITGETGTGKELIARAIHKRSQRSSRAFVSVNCAAIPVPLIASELFGHEKGAFTGALQRRLGRFELAEGGTIFLDEIGELPAETQIALLRVLQEHEFERVGGNQAIRANVRVIAATNRDIKSAIVAGTFRSDLFYRLNVFPIDMPPLRERKEDIPILVEYFIHRYAGKAGKKIRGINKKTLDLFQSYPWPGNIRELQNVIERSVIVCDTESFSVDESWLVRESRQTQPASRLLSDKLLTQEQEMIEAALVESRGRVSGPLGAAAKLGIPPSTLESKIRSLKINKHRFKSA
jgi:PAS domain S-box-containing protein